MEIEIDSALVRSIGSDEVARARAEIATLGPVAALGLSQQRHDERLAAAGDANTLACKNGCYWCCYFSVDVRAVEVFRILDFMQSELTPQANERIREEIQANSAALERLNEDERVRRNLKCPFLDAGRCTIYGVRPQTCRNYHATNVAGCQQAFEEPDNDDIDPEFAPLVYQTGVTHVEAFSHAMRDAQFDTDVYELNTAIAATLQDPVAARMRFEAKELPFNKEGAEAPIELLVLD